MSPRRRWIVGIMGLVVVLTISASAMWSERSRLVRWLVIRQLYAATSRQATIERVDLDLRQGRLEIVGLRLADREPGPPLAELDRLDVRFNPRSLLLGHFPIGEVTLRGVRVRIVRSERGDLNIQDLWAQGQSTGGFTVDHFALADGHVFIEDRTRTPIQTWRVDDIAVDVNGLSTQPEHAPGSARLSATVAKAPVSAEISELRLAPLQLRGHVTLSDVDATLVGIFLPASAVAVVEGARLTATMKVAVDPRQGVSLDANGRLDTLALRNRRTGHPVASVPSLAFTVTGAHVDAARRAITPGRIEVTGAATLFDARGSAAGRLAIEPLRLLIADDAAATPSTARVTATAAFSGGGRFEAQGPLRLAPVAAEVRARITDLDATVLLSYIALPVQFSAAVDSDLSIDVATSSSGGITSRIRGRAAVKRAAITDGTREVARVREIAVDGVDAAWPRATVARVRVIEPVALVQRDQEGRVSLATLLTPARPELHGGSADGLPPGAAIEIGEIAVNDGTLTLDDATATPPARLMLTRVRASARNAAWPAHGPMSIDLHAAMPDAGTLETTGTVSLNPVRIEVRTRLAGAALAPYQGHLPFAMRVRGFAHLDLAIAASLGPSVAITAKGTGGLNDLAMSEGDNRILRVARIEAAGLDYAWPATLTVDRLRVGRSQVRVERRADGTFPLGALFARVQAPPVKTEPAVPVPGRATSPVISVRVRDALLEDGGVRFVDGVVSPTNRVEVSEVRLAARDFAWPARAPMPIEFRAATPGGGRVSVNGTLDLAGASLDAKVVLGAIDLAPAQPYLPVRAHVAAKATADIDVKAKLRPISITARGSASLGDVAFGHDDRPVVGVTRVEVTGLDYAWPTKVAIDRLRVQAPRALVERTPEGRFPLVTFFSRLREAPVGRPEPESTVDAAAPPLQMSIRESVLEDGSATITDGAVSPAARFDVTGVRLVVRDFAWPPRGPTSMRLRASLPGEGTVRARGQLGLAPTSLDLDVNVDAVDLAAARPYLPLRGQIGGKAGAALKVNVTTEPLAITARGTASLADLVASEGDRRLLTAERVELTALDYTWPATVSVDRLRVEKPWALIDRVSGQLPVLDVLGSPPPRDARRRTSRADDAPRQGPAASRTPASSAPPPALQLKVRRSLVQNGAVTIIDGSVDPPARLEITDARLALRDLAWPSREASVFVLRAATPNGGRIEARGQLRLDTPTIDTKLVVERADLAALQPLTPVRGRFAGKANADLQVKGTLTPLALSITGRLGVADASFGDAERALVTAKSVDFTGVKAEWPQRWATIQQIGVREPWALVEREADGGLPLLALVAPRPSSGTAAAAAPDGTAPSGRAAPTTAGGEANAPRMEVGTLVVESGFIRFLDLTTKPRFVEEASRLSVTARGLNTAPGARSEIVVDTRLTGGAQLNLHGTMGPIGGPLFADAQGKLSGLPLNRANPYLNQLLGWIAREGSLDGTTQFRIKDDHLEALSEIVIAQPQFAPSRRGDEVRQRVGVPLDLLVSLLENSRREVHLSVPVTGTLSSRQFDFGDAVWEAIRKAAIHVLALPVSWVGKIFYTADSHIATIAIWPVSFEPGTTRMRRGIDTHAQRLATFMHQTPSIAFTMKPVMTVEDVDALKREALRQRIDTLARDTGSPDSAAARLFAEHFPGRPAPTEPAALMTELAKAERLPDGALRTLATARIALVRQELEAKGGVDPTRLRVSDGALPVEASGAGRVEFEMTPDIPATE